MRTIVAHAFALVVLVNGIHGEASPDGELKQICVPGSQTKEDCNTCVCNQYGTALGCTRLACPKIPAEYLNPDGSLKLPHQMNPLLRSKRDQLCEPNTVREWECNNCRCTPDGTAEVCTRRICPGSKRERRDVGLRCTPNESFMDDCNHCRCSFDGRSAACTLMACPSMSLSGVDGSIKHPYQRNPLLRVRRDLLCTPNTTRVWECNNCRCSSDGQQEMCTRRICPAVPRSKRDVPFSCVPNESYMDDCNTCFCSPDGRSAGCTYKFCVHDDDVASIYQPKVQE